MRICVDTTILIDVLKDEFRPFQDKLYEAIASNEQLVSPSVVFGELMPQFKGDEKQVADFLSDFYIGGFALAKCDAILTRDRGIYKKYFPTLVGYADCLA